LAAAVLAGGGAAAGYPELNPVGRLWASLNGNELANLAGDTLEEIIAAAERGIRGSGPPRTCRFRSRATADCPYGENHLTGTATFFGLAHAGSL
jgi:hypothetical protein